jgi:hypothetical protein
LAVLLTLLITRGADSISEYSSMTLLGSAMVSLVLATITRSYTWERLRDGAVLRRYCRRCHCCY